MTTRNSDEKNTRTKGKPATTPDGRENQLISLATELAERRLREGTATAAEVVHFLRLGSSREKLEQERLRHENALTEAKANDLASRRGAEDLYSKALNAFRAYSGNAFAEEEVSYEDPNIF